MDSWLYLLVLMVAVWLAVTPASHQYYHYVAGMLQ